jgi:hypothetical protein
VDWGEDVFISRQNGQQLAADRAHVAEAQRHERDEWPYPMCQCAICTWYLKHVD